jgi:hypothetical protein
MKRAPKSPRISTREFHHAKAAKCAKRACSLVFKIQLCFGRRRGHETLTDRTTAVDRTAESCLSFLMSSPMEKSGDLAGVEACRAIAKRRRVTRLKLTSNHRHRSNQRTQPETPDVPTAKRACVLECGGGDTAVTHGAPGAHAH